MAGKIENLIKKKDALQFVNDYDTELEEDENGKVHKKTVYVGPIIGFLDEPKTIKPKLTASLFMSLIIVGLIVYGNMINHSSAWSVITAMTMGVELFPALFLLMGAFNLPFNAKPMHRDKYMHSIIRVFRSLGAIAVMMAVLIIYEIVYRTKNSDWLFLSGDKQFIFVMVVSLILCVAEIVLLRTVNIDEKELEERNRMEKMV